MCIQANLPKRRQPLLAMHDAVYGDTLDQIAIMAIRPKSALSPVFNIVAIRVGSEVVFNQGPPLAPDRPEAANSYFSWRRGRVNIHLNTCLAVLTGCGKMRVGAGIDL